jgi:tetrapyrrole methylase family protein/MazG family protein
MLSALIKVMETLLGPDGCPWDKKQTHKSLRADMLDECYEAADAIDRGDMGALCEELGDVLHQIIFHAKLAEMAGAFTLEDVVKSITSKLISRHSHVFGNDKAVTGKEVEALWEKNKNKEKNLNSKQDILEAIPKSLPALARAQTVIKKSDIVLNKQEIYKGLHDLLSEIEPLDSQKKECFEMLGGVLFNLVKISILLEINAEFSLTNQIQAFITSNNTVVSGETTI